MKVSVSVGVLVGVFVKVKVSVGVSVGVTVGVTGLMMLLVLKVTAPIRANARPSNAAPTSNVIEIFAMMVPLKIESVPRVLLLPTCQNRLSDCAPLIKMTWLLTAVMRVDPILKIKTELGSS